MSGVEMDLSLRRYASWEELRGYCQLVAGVVGRMCVRIFGFESDDALERANSLGAALQLINILRDVREDASMGRVYLPQADLARFGVSEDAVLAGEPDGAWTSLVEFEAARARRLYAAGHRGLPAHPRAGPGLRPDHGRDLQRDPRPHRGGAGAAPPAAGAALLRARRRR